MRKKAITVFLLYLAAVYGFARDPSGLDGGYNPEINPEDFSTVIDNYYYPLLPGTVTVHEGKTDEGTEVILVEVTHETREVMGIPAVVVRDRVWANGELVEDTDDWFAQDSEGNVWYLGEISREYENGEVVSYEGSWESGADGAIPGIIIHGAPEVGIPYYQEYWEGEAEDMAEVAAIGETVITPYGTYENCLKLKEWNPLEKGSREYKYFAPGIGVVVEAAGLERIYLVDTIPESEVEAFISKVESRKYQIPIGAEASMAAGIEDVNTDERAFYISPAVSWEILESGLNLSLELNIPVNPGFELESLALIEEYEFELEDLYLLFYAANENTITPDDTAESEGLVSLGISYLDFLSCELNLAYMPDIELGSELGAGYELVLGKQSLLEFQGGLNFILYDEPGLSDVEFDISFSHFLDAFNITLGIEPVMEIEKVDDKYETDFLITPYIICSYSF